MALLGPVQQRRKCQGAQRRPCPGADGRPDGTGTGTCPGTQRLGLCPPRPALRRWVGSLLETGVSVKRILRLAMTDVNDVRRFHGAKLA